MGTSNVGGRRVRCDDGQIRTMVDATADLKAMIQEMDVEHAVCGDPANCAIAQAVMRVEANHGRPDTKCIVGAAIAYVVRGDTVIRYQVPPNEAALIRTFDAAGIFPTGFTVTLRPVAPHDKLGERVKSRGRKDRSRPPARDGKTPRLPTRRVGGPRFLPNKP